jgi:hypothetical protein
MPDFYTEIDRDVCHIAEELSQGIAPISHEISGIKYTPHHKRDEDTSETTLEEGGNVHLQRKEEIPRNHDEQGYFDGSHGIQPPYQRHLVVSRYGKVGTDVISLGHVLPNHKETG